MSAKPTPLGGTKPMLAGTALGLPPAAADPGQSPFVFPPGTYTFTPPRRGQWKFIGWGPGSSATATVGGTSGAYVEKTYFLGFTSPVNITAGAGSTDTTITPPGGLVVTAGAGVNTTTPGIASNGDVNLNGSLPTVAGLGSGGGPAGADGAGQGGAGAPAVLPYRGGRGGTTSPNDNQNCPGGGGFASSIAGLAGGGGLVIAVFVRD